MADTSYRSSVLPPKPSYAPSTPMVTVPSYGTRPPIGFGSGSTGVPAPGQFSSISGYSSAPADMSMIGGSAGVSFNNVPTNLSASSMNAPMSNLAPVTSPRPLDNPNIANPVGDAAKTGGFFGADGFNVGDIGTIADVIGGFGSIWSGIQANKLAKEEMALQKQAYQTNLASSISSYNLALEDRMRARYTQNDRSQAEASAYIDANRLKA